MTEEHNYTELANLVYLSQHFPSHLMVTRSAKTVPDGIFVSVVDDRATKAYIEVAMRESVAAGKDPLLGIWEHAPKVHVYRQDQYVTSEQVSTIQSLLTSSGIPDQQFLDYMKTSSVETILAKDYKKAVTMFEAKDVNS